jgi:hypothetical protein
MTHLVRTLMIASITLPTPFQHLPTRVCFQPPYTPGCWKHPGPSWNPAGCIQHANRGQLFPISNPKMTRAAWASELRLQLPLQRSRRTPLQLSVQVGQPGRPQRRAPKRKPKWGRP